MRGCRVRASASQLVLEAGPATPRMSGLAATVRAVYRKQDSDERVLFRGVSHSLSETCMQVLVVSDVNN